MATRAETKTVFGLSGPALKQVETVLSEYGVSVEEYVKLSLVLLLTTKADLRHDIILQALENMGQKSVEVSEFVVDESGRGQVIRKMVEV